MNTHYVYRVRARKGKSDTMKQYLPQALAVLAIVFMGLAVATTWWWVVPGIIFGVLSGTVGSSASQDAN